MGKRYLVRDGDGNIVERCRSRAAAEVFADLRGGEHFVQPEGEAVASSRALPFSPGNGRAMAAFILEQKSVERAQFLLDEFKLQERVIDAAAPYVAFASVLVREGPMFDALDALREVPEGTGGMSVQEAIDEFFFPDGMLDSVPPAGQDTYPSMPGLPMLDPLRRRL